MTTLEEKAADLIYKDDLRLIHYEAERARFEQLRDYYEICMNACDKQIWAIQKSRVSGEPDKTIK